mgnify:CR=1 FL=1
MLKIVVDPLFGSLEKIASKKLLVMIHNLVGKNVINEEESLEFLREFVSEADMLDNLSTYLNNFD